MPAPRELPIYELESSLVAAVRAQGRLIVQAPTGSGKSTQVPQMLLNHGLLTGRASQKEEAVSASLPLLDRARGRSAHRAWLAACRTEKVSFGRELFSVRDDGPEKQFSAS